MGSWLVVRRWRVRADRATDAIELALPGQHEMTQAVRLPVALLDPADYSEMPEHLLHGVPVEIIKAARSVTGGAGDVAVADAIVIALKPWLRELQ